MNISAGLGKAPLHSASDAIVATGRGSRITFWKFPAGETIGRMSAAREK
jgi:hypothetical protein